MGYPKINRNNCLIFFTLLLALAWLFTLVLCVDTTDPVLPHESPSQHRIEISLENRSTRQVQKVSLGVVTPVSSPYESQEFVLNHLSHDAANGAFPVFLTGYQDDTIFFLDLYIDQSFQRLYFDLTEHPPLSPSKQVIVSITENQGAIQVQTLS